MDGKRTGLVVVLALAGATFLAGTAAAEDGLGFKGVGGKLMFVDPEDIESTFGVGGLVYLGEVVPSLHLEGQLDYWGKTYDSSSSLLHDFKSEVKFRDIALGGTMKYTFPTSNEAWEPFVLGGLALHFLHTSVEVKSGGASSSADDSETKLGFDLGGGANYLMNSNLVLGGALKYRVVSDVSQIELGVSATMLLGE